MTIELLNTVILAQDFERLRDWYVATLNLVPVTFAWEGKEYRYVELTSNGSYVLGMAGAEEMGVAPISPRRNTTLPQLYVSELGELLQRVADNGGTVLSGPTFSEAFGGYRYGGFADPEGNEIWAIDRKEFTPQL